MERFTQQIIGILRENKISCSYKASWQTIYAYRQEQYGEIFSFYYMFGSKINNLMIYSLAIPECRQEAVINYLVEVDHTLADSCFFIDPQTSCIAFNAVYNPSDEQEAINDQCFANFCKGGYEAFYKYQYNLYVFAIGKDEKKYQVNNT